MSFDINAIAKNAIAKMDRASLNSLKSALDAYNRTGNMKYFEEIVKIIGQFDESDAQRVRRSGGR